MFCTDEVQDSGLKRALRTVHFYNDNEDAIIYKYTSKLAKDKVAAAFISHESLISGSNFEQTAINAICGRTGMSKCLTANRPLSFEALIGLVCKLNADGYIVSDMANVSCKNDKRMVSVEELSGTSDILKISIPEDTREIFKVILHDAYAKVRPSYRVQKICVDSAMRDDKQIRTIEDAITSSIRLQDRYEIKGIGINMVVLVNPFNAYIIDNNGLTIVESKIYEIDSGLCDKISEAFTLVEENPTVHENCELFVI